ncbi:unnamed protein product [Linum tenue]|nr:unnamed protein product [Linum tenue]
MIDGYVRNGSPGEGLECFLLMRSMGVKADEVTVVSALSAAGSLCYAWIGKWLHGFYVESGRVRWDVFVGSALVDMYMKCGHSDDARQVFDEMPTRNVVSWSCLVAGYVQLGRCKEALLIFQDMLTDNLRPNSKTLTSVLTACAQLGALDQGKWVHAYIDRNLIELNSILGTALIDMYVKCGCINEACFVFDKLPSKGLYTWTAMINGLAMNGDALGSLSFFSRMMCSGVQPNKVTFLGALSACSHGGLVEEGRKLFDEMRDKYHLDPDVDHYGCMVDLLGRAGYLEEAVKLIEEMPMEPSPSIWGALLGACVIHKNLELGEYIGNQLVNLQPDHSGWYSLLANVHLEHRKWDKAASVRKSMKMKGIDKIPGVSWIEVNGLIRDFVTSESLSDWELCEMMDSVWRHIVSSIYDHKVDNFNISGCGEGLKGVVL